jgi:hypothetical protein
MTGQLDKMTDPSPNFGLFQLLDLGEQLLIAALVLVDGLDVKPGNAAAFVDQKVGAV